MLAVSNISADIADFFGFSFAFISSNDSPSCTSILSSSSSSSSAIEILEGTPTASPDGTRILLNRGLKAPKVTIAKISMVNNFPSNSLIAEFSYQGISINSISSTNSPLEIVIESPLSSLKPIASLTKDSMFSFFSSLTFSKTCSPASFNTNFSLIKIAATILLMLPVGF